MECTARAVKCHPLVMTTDINRRKHTQTGLISEVGLNQLKPSLFHDLLLSPIIYTSFFASMAKSESEETNSKTTTKGKKNKSNTIYEI